MHPFDLEELCQTLPDLPQLASQPTVLRCIECRVRDVGLELVADQQTGRQLGNVSLTATVQNLVPNVVVDSPNSEGAHVLRLAIYRADGVKRNMTNATLEI